MSKSLELKSSRDMAEDLSLINGLPNKINLDYIKNIQQLILYRISEARLGGKKDIDVDIPLLGVLSIRVSNPKANESNFKIKDLSYTFKPYDMFSKDLIKVFNNEGFDLPEMLANKYGDKILKIYNDLF